MSMQTEGSYNYYRRKADQAWEIAGLAHHDGDTANEIKLTQEAREWDQLAAEARPLAKPKNV